MDILALAAINAKEAVKALSDANQLAKQLGYENIQSMINHAKESGKYNNIKEFLQAEITADQWTAVDSRLIKEVFE